MNNQTQLFTNPAWHGLGTLLQSGCDSQQALEAAGLDWSVEMVDQPTVIDSLGRECVSDRQRALVRMDTASILHIHGGSYSPVQNSDLFDMAFSLEGGVEVEAAGSLEDGRKLFLLLRGSTQEFKGDMVVPYLALTNSHDGSARFAAVPTSVRLSDGTVSSILFDKSQRTYTLVHKGSMQDKITQMKKTLARFNKDLADWAVKVDRLQSKTLTEKELVNFWGDVYASYWGLPLSDEDKAKSMEKMEDWRAALDHNMVTSGYPDVDLWSAAHAVASSIQQEVPQRKKDGWEGRSIHSKWFGGKESNTSQAFRIALTKHV